MMGDEINVEKTLLLSLKLSEVAEGLANNSNFEQGQFLNVFAKTLKIYCNDDHLHQLQLSSIVDILNDDGIKMIKELNEFILLKEAKH